MSIRHVILTDEEFKIATTKHFVPIDELPIDEHDKSVLQEAANRKIKETPVANEDPIPTVVCGMERDTVVRRVVPR